MQGLERYLGLGRRICLGSPPVTGEGAALVLRMDMRSMACIKPLLAKENLGTGNMIKQMSVYSHY